MLLSLLAKLSHRFDVTVTLAKRHGACLTSVELRLPISCQGSYLYSEVFGTSIETQISFDILSRVYSNVPGLDDRA